MESGKHFALNFPSHVLQPCERECFYAGTATSVCYVASWRIQPDGIAAVICLFYTYFLYLTDGFSGFILTERSTAVKDFVNQIRRMFANRLP